MSHLLYPGETSLLKELRDSEYYVWMNDHNDLTAGQIPGWTESHADEIYYSGQCSHAPGPVNPDLRGMPGNKHYYSHFEGQLKLDSNGQNYSSDDEVVNAAIRRIQNPVDGRPMCPFWGLMFPHTPYQVEEPYFSAIDRAKLAARRIVPGRQRFWEPFGRTRPWTAIRRRTATSFEQSTWACA